MMNTVKKITGIVLMLLAPIILFILFKEAVDNIQTGGNKDINKPIPWIVIIGLFTPITAGLFIFGYYAFKGEYNHLPSNSKK